jgi:hypothetical protein
MTPAGTLVLLNPEPTFKAIESAGGRVTKHAEEVSPAMYCSGVKVVVRCRWIVDMRPAFGSRTYPGFWNQF